MVFNLKKSIEGSLTNFGFLGFSKILSQLVHLLFLAVVTRKLGVELFGKLNVFLMVAQFFFLITCSWTAIGYTNFSVIYSTERKKVSEVFWSRLQIVLTLVLFFFVLSVIGKQQLVSYLDLPPFIIYLLYFYLISLLIIDFSKQMAQVTTNFKSISLLQLMEKLVLLGGILFVNDGFFPIITLMFIIPVVTRSGFIFFMNKELYWPFQVNIKLCKKILYFSYPLLLISLGGFIFGWVDIAVIKQLSPMHQVGIYSLAYNGLGAVESIVLLMPMVLNPIFVSLVSEGRHDLTGQFISRIIPQITFLWGGIGLCMVFCSIWVIPAVFGNQFVETVNIFIILLLCIHIGAFNALISSVLIGYNKIPNMAKINIGAAMINLFLDLVLIPLFGIIGAAFATVIAYLFISICYYSQIKTLSTLNISRQITFLGILFFQILIVLICKKLMMVILITVGAICLYFISSKHLKIFTAEDKNIYNRMAMPNFFKMVMSKICDLHG